MKIEVFSNPDNFRVNSSSSSLLLDDRVLLDAGPGADNITVPMVAKIENLILTHSHLDHTSMLCFLVDTRIDNGNGINIHCLKETADAVRRGLLNNDIWPDMESVEVEGRPMINFNYIKECYVEMEIGGCRITPFPVIHQVPTLGYCLHGDRGNFIYMTDFWDVNVQVWKWLNGIERLEHAVFEISFPDGMERIAEISGHLTPGLLQQRLEKLSSHPPQMYYCHVKPQFADKINEQVKSRFGEKIKALKSGMVFNI